MRYPEYYLFKGDHKMPVISVVIPLYNKEHHIKRAIDSVLCQKIQDFELIIVDDGSTDKSAEIVRSINDERIKLIRQENAGVSAARNRGIEEAKADLVAFLDADDEWTVYFLETINRLKEKYPEAGLYATAYQFFSRNSKIRLANYKEIPSAPWEGLLKSYFLSAAKGDHPVCSSAVCIPRDILRQKNGFKEGVWWGEDDDLWGRIAFSHPIAFSWQIGAIYHLESNNRACNRMELVEHPFIKEAELFIQEGYVRKEMIDDLRECVARYKILSAMHNLHVGENQVSRNMLKSCKTKVLYQKKFFCYILSLIPHEIFVRIVDLKRKTQRS